MGIAVLLTILFILGVDIYTFLSTTPNKEKTGKTINIVPGTKFYQIAFALKEKGIISDIKKFTLLARLKGAVSKVKAGEYALDTTMTPLHVLDVLEKGKVIKYRITIPEGYTVFQVAALIKEAGIAKGDCFAEKAFDPSLLTSMSIKGKSFEGYLFPDTYFFTKGINQEEIIRVMTDRFKTVFNENFVARAKELGLNEKDVVTLASIIEKETYCRQEKYLISAVFHNRLRKGIRLQSDPTVIYGLKSFNGNLTKRDLQKKTPYNTYRIKGLPPGPICNPGKEAIEAVLNPAQTDYLYFVSKNDGTHYFSKNLVEHNQAVAKYQKRKRRKKVLE